MALKDFIGKAVGNFIQQGASIADEFTLSKEEREEFRQRDAQRALQLQQTILKAVEARYEQVKSVIADEMAQGDNFTKRARPSIVYAGLLMHFVQMIGKGFGIEFEIDPSFTMTWGGVCGVWIVGRSAEKIKVNGAVGKAAGLITGSRAGSLPDL